MRWCSSTSVCDGRRSVRCDFRCWGLVLASRVSCGPIDTRLGWADAGASFAGIMLHMVPPIGLPIPLCSPRTVRQKRRLHSQLISY